jgi:HK97 family phage prohead protease
MNKTMSKKIYTRSHISREDTESRTIKGMAVVFNSWSNDLGGFIERILPGAITQELIDSSDIIANYEHDSPNYMLARSRGGEGKLQLELREDGLHFQFEAPTTPKGDEILFHVRSGNLDECYFAFTLADDPDAESWYRDENNQLCRDIKKIDGLYDISLVLNPAYSDTYVFARKRGLDMIKGQEEIINNVLDSRLRELDIFKIK